MAKQRAISLAKFADCFGRAWLTPRGGIHLDRRAKKDDLLKLPRRIGLAVSGGADSMALAYLCRQMELSAKPWAISLTAFVVDHRARQESSQEARKVAGWLSKMGIETKVLELDWSPFSASKDSLVQDGVAVSLPTAFETHARRLRFQALGNACRERGIETLLMGHHSDDSIETTIWRLSAGARGPGLAGIPEVAPIPECHGLFGVSESGSSIRLAAEADGPSSRLQVSLDDNNRGKIQFLRANDKPTGRKRKQAALSVSKTIIPENPSTIATGGILLCRPLLSFPKSRLVATCAENEVPYVSDPTNFDPTLTVRNAIRSLLYSKSLPRAFQPDSILHLIRSSQSLLRRSEKLTSRLLQAQCHILDLNLRTGTMVIQFSQAQTWANALENILASRIRQIHSIVLRRITELLSPFPANHFGLRSFESFTPRIFPQHNVLSGQESESRSKYLSERKPFTVGGVLFNPLTVVDSTSGASNGTQSREKNVWLLSRQPFMKNRGSTLRIDVPVSQPEKITTPSEKSNPPHAFTPWTLWDDRYWFRFSVVPKPASNFDQSAEPKIDKIPLFIRPFQKSDLVRIRNDPGTLAGEKQGRVQPNPALTSSITRALLISQAPGLTRFTIPLLTLGEPCDSEQTGDTGNEHLLALPTLEHRLSGRNPKGETSCPRKLEILYAKRWWIVEWEWMYKMIDTEDLRLMGKPVQADADMVHTERSR